MKFVFYVGEPGYKELLKLAGQEQPYKVVFYPNGLGMDYIEVIRNEHDRTN